MLITEIKSKDWGLSTTAQGEVVQGLRDIAQCIDIIIKTAKGSDPLRPEFGCDLRALLDRPVTEAWPSIIREITAAIERWETRAIVTRVSYKLEVSTIIIKLEWKTASGLASENEIRL